VRICCLVSSLEAGGAERVMTLLANAWAERGREVALVTLAGSDAEVYRLSPRVQRIALGLEVPSRSPLQAVRANIRKVLGLRRAVRLVAPDVVISFVTKLNVLAILACTGLGVPVVVSERSHPDWDRIGRVWSLLRWITYPLADALVVQSRAVREWADHRFSTARTHVIPNPVTIVSPQEEPGAGRERRPIVLAVGRLAPEKGFDLLIRAFASVAKTHPEWSLVIVGAGPEASALRQLARDLLQEGRVIFPGLVRDVEPYYRQAGLFVLSSRYEGFPNALMEAMAFGCPVIATASPGGTTEIVRDGLDGILVPPDELSPLVQEMYRLMSNASERARLGAHAVDVRVRFGLDGVLNHWDEVVVSAAPARSGSSRSEAP
jgi:glycosyltransferase involved in cell wall biosynthesis